MISTILSHSLFIGVAVGAAITRESIRTTGLCRNIPGDSGWPTSVQWSQLNTTVGGRLIATNPIAHVCHAPTYSETDCASLSKEWDVPGLLTFKPAEILHPWFQNQTCVPFTANTTSCELGNYASYSVDVRNVDDIAAGLTFAQEHNIRLVIKNTGHDFAGKSTGKGALSLWTHNLDSRELLPAYNAPYYSGPALKVGAGVQGGAAAEFAAQHGYRVVVGTCPDVGMAGGYTQGGGHSFLTGLYGLGADNVLEWEVVTASGQHLIATPTQNTDLYWALSGGGGGTYGVVVSLTTRLFPDGIISSGSLSFTVTTAGGVDEYWDAVETFTSHLQSLVDDYGMAAAVLISNDTLSLSSIMAPGRTDDELTTLMQPMISALGQEVVGTLNTKASDATSYFDLYSSTLEPLIAPNPLSPVMGGRFVSRDNMASNSSRVVAGLRAATEGGHFWLAATALSTNSSARVVAPVASNAVQPGFSDAFLTIIIGTLWSWDRPWNEAGSMQEELMDRVMPALETATPGAGAYLNEANWQQADWQHVFHGDNYEKLRAIKSAYDPQSIFYGLTAVGSEAWSADADGRLCKTGL